MAAKYANITSIPLIYIKNRINPNHELIIRLNNIEIDRARYRIQIPMLTGEELRKIVILRAKIAETKIVSIINKPDFVICLWNIILCVVFTLVCRVIIINQVLEPCLWGPKAHVHLH